MLLLLLKLLLKQLNNVLSDPFWVRICCSFSSFFTRLWYSYRVVAELDLLKILFHHSTNRYDNRQQYPNITDCYI
jgi:hypothetical protein